MKKENEEQMNLKKPKECIMMLLTQTNNKHEHLGRLNAL